MKCPSCGTENHEDARFCKSCAAPLTPSETSPPENVVAPPPPPPPPVYVDRRRQPHQEFVGLMGFAFFLVAVAIVFAQNPNLFEGLRRWTDIVGANRTVLVRPPEAIIVSAAWFFGAMGVFEFVSAFIRWSLRWLPLRVASRLLSGIGDLVFAALLLRYSDRAISGGLVIMVLVAVFAGLLMLYVTLGMYWSRGRVFLWIPAAEPRVRP